MCGIAFAARPKTATPCPDFESIWASAKASVASRGPDCFQEVVLPHDGIELRFFASVLHMRGRQLVEQPVTTATSCLIWNGELFDGQQLAEDESDTSVVTDLLEEATDGTVDLPPRVVDNPFAFVFFSSNTGLVTLARDPLGRRSLNLVESVDRSGQPFMLVASSFLDPRLSSLAVELPTDRVTALRLSEPGISRPGISRDAHLRTNTPTVLNAAIPSSEQRLAPHMLDAPPPAFISASKALASVLSDAVHRRVYPLPLPPATTSSHPLTRVGILFSGGIDCTVLALLAHRHLPQDEPIDLLNVAFELKAGDGFDVPDRLTARDALAELGRVASDRSWRLVEIDVTKEEYLKERATIVELTKPQNTVMDLSISSALYFAARGEGRIKLEGSVVPYRSTARCLLSGLGADELLGGYSRHRLAFQSSVESHTEDRRAKRKRESGQASSPAKWAALIAELQMDLDRLPTRNLGRDDRVISFHGREPRYPFLDGRVISHLAETPVWLKCDHDLGQGVGDKLLLRLTAARMGLTSASRRTKRAIQFGARSAKLDGGKNGADVVTPLVNGLGNGTPSMSSDAKTLEALVGKLRPTIDDEAASLDPSRLRLASLDFAGHQCVMLGHPPHLVVAAQKAATCPSVDTSSHSSVRVGPVAGKGLGVIAARELNCGELIITERPLLVMPEKLSADDHRTLDMIYSHVFDLLDEEGKAVLMSLSVSANDAEDADPIVSRVTNNEISLSLAVDSGASGHGTFSYTGVFPLIARHNHSCAPNARWHFDDRPRDQGGTFAMRLNALRRIREGEEVSVSYIEHLKSRWERAAQLFARWGFDCTCEACGASSTDGMAPDERAVEVKRVQESNRRRELLGAEDTFFRQLIDRLRQGWTVEEDVFATVARAQEAIRLVEEEGLHEEKELFQRAVAMLWCRQGPERARQAVEAAQEALLMVGAVKGEESQLYREILALSRGATWDEVFASG